MTGVPAMKNWCCKIPPGSNREGINPKSLPLLILRSSVKNSFGSAQNEYGYLLLRLCILLTQASAYGSFLSPLPPINIFILPQVRFINSSTTSKINNTPFCCVILPINEKMGTL